MLNRKLTYLFIIFAGLILAGCGEDSSTVDNVPPSVPVLMVRSADDIYPQRGIRPEPSTYDQNYWVRLEWRKNTEPDIFGYRVWRCGEWDTTSTGELTGGYVIADMRLGTDFNADTLVWIDRASNILAPELSDGTTRGYYWQIEAYDDAGNYSGRSSSQYYRLMKNPLNPQVEKITDGLYRIRWQYDNSSDVYLSYYMLRIFSEQYGPDSVMWYQKTQLYGSDNAVLLNSDSTAIRPFVPGTTYRCQINAVADQPTPLHRYGLAGSAVYTTFTYQN